MSEKNNQINAVIGRQNELGIELEKQTKIDLEIGKLTGGGSYPPLSGKPQINNVTLIGNKTSEELKLQDKMTAMSVQEIEKILYLDD